MSERSLDPVSVTHVAIHQHPTLIGAAAALHAYLGGNHLHMGRLAGADQGVRWNIRVWRFLKSYLPMLRPEERYYFLQGQAYWALASWTLGDLTGDPAYQRAAESATRAILETQRPDGSWAYPLPERRHLVATVEGDFGAVALIEAFERSGDRTLLDGALRWHAYVEREIGYQSHPAGLCVNYFQKPRGLVPNNTCEWIWVLGRLALASGDERYLNKVPEMLGFLEAVMLPTGELPYELPGAHEPRLRVHYLCYQYNAFQCMKLAWHASLHGDELARTLALRVARYIATGVLESGAVRASCQRRKPEVLYYADAVGMALHTVTSLGWADYGQLADRTFRFVLSRQRANGALQYFSRGDYGVLQDRNDYPRYLAMTLYHLCQRALDARPF